MRIGLENISDKKSDKNMITEVRMTLAFSNNEETRKKIVDTSAKIQEVLHQ